MNKPIIPLIGYRLGLMNRWRHFHRLAWRRIIISICWRSRHRAAFVSGNVGRIWPVMILAFIGLRAHYAPPDATAYPYQRGDQCGAWQVIMLALNGDSGQGPSGCTGQSFA
jgi:hypothetical protein